MRIRLHAPWHGGWGRLTRTARRAVGEFFADNSTKLAAAISFHVLFALFPLAILLVALGGVLLRDEDVKDDVLGSLFDVLPLSGEGQERLEELLDSVAGARNALGLIAVLGLLWTASGLMAAVRTALNLAWDVRARRPPLQGKLVDILLVGFVGILVMLSVALTATLEVAGAIGERLGPFGEGASALVSVAGFLAPVLVLFVAALTVYKFVPASRPPFRDIWLGAAFAAVGHPSMAPRRPRASSRPGSGRILEAAGRLVEDPEGDGDERDPVGERGEDLRPLEPERPLRRRRLRGDPDGEERERDGDVVGEHVRGVGEQGEAAGQKAADDLGDRVRCRERKRDGERAPVRGAVAAARPVAVTGTHQAPLRVFRASARGLSRPSSSPRLSSSRCLPARRRRQQRGLRAGRATRARRGRSR